MKNSDATKKEICTLAYTFDKDTVMARHVLWAQIKLKEGGVLGESAKMGTHLTVFPPFYATKTIAQTYAAMIRVGGFAKKDFPDAISGVHLGYFPPTSPSSFIEAVHLQINLESGYSNFISRMKQLGIFEWVHTPQQTAAVEPVYVPHIHLLEGEDIIHRAQQCKENIDLFFQNKHYPLGELRLFIKKPGKSEGTPLRWEQVLV